MSLNNNNNNNNNNNKVVMSEEDYLPPSYHFQGIKRQRSLILDEEKWILSFDEFKDIMQRHIQNNKNNKNNNKNNTNNDDDDEESSFMKNNKYNFIIIGDEIRLTSETLFKGAENQFNENNKPRERAGHSSLLTPAEWKRVKRGEKLVKYAGEFKIDRNGYLQHWGNSSGHFRPSGKFGEIIAKQLGFPLGENPVTGMPFFMKFSGKKKQKKKIRKHSGINKQTGRLNKGYRYSGKELKSGLSQIIKCKY